MSKVNRITLNLPDGRSSQIAIGEKLNNLLSYTGNRKTVILTDTIVAELYRNSFPKDVLTIVIPCGEQNKTFDTITGVIRQMLAAGIDRSCFMVGIGGGIVCDITGFAASIYMRGINFGFVASTLLAQADASVGGKNGVNFDGYKNIAGVFNQPEFVICETEMLQTLPARQIRAGMAEIVKAALLADKNLFDYIVSHKDKIADCNTETMTTLVTRSIQIKSSIVEADERESGVRRKLNLGHTFGHAIEKNSQLLHGEAVSIGMAISADISQALGLLSPDDNSSIKQLLKNIGLPVETDIPKAALLDAITLDKKKDKDKLYFVLNKGVGDAEVRAFDYHEIAELLLSINS
jgi:3-dehydroquinate synthase